MTDAPIAFPSNRPEYTVADARKRLSRAVYGLAVSYGVSVSLASDFGTRMLCDDIGTILSALSTAESEIAQCRKTLRLKPSESLPAGVTRLALQVESAEAEVRREQQRTREAEEGVQRREELVAELDRERISLRSRLESAERERDEARAVVADAEYALACEGGSFGYDSMQRLRRSVEAFDHTYGATTGPCQSPSTSKGVTNG